MNRQHTLILVIIILVVCAASLLAMPQLKQRFISGSAAGTTPTNAEQTVPDREYPATSGRASRRSFDSSQPQIVDPVYNGAGQQAQPSYEVLQQMKDVGPDGQRNLYFYTEEQARRMGLKKYTSGPCKGYYQGEEWWCR
jgi:hypothetical protein